MIDKSDSRIHKQLKSSIKNYSDAYNRLLKLCNHEVYGPNIEDRFPEHCDSIDVTIIEVLELSQSIVSILQVIQDLYQQNPTYQEQKSIDRLIEVLNTRSNLSSQLRDDIQLILVTEYNCSTGCWFWKRKSKHGNMVARCNAVGGCRNWYRCRDREHRLSQQAIDKIVRSCRLMSGESTPEKELDRRLTKIESSLLYK